MLMSILWAFIWAITIFSTYQTAMFHVLGMAGRAALKFGRIAVYYEILAALGWGGIIVFWMH